MATETDQAAWNLSAKITQLLGYFIASASSSYVRGNYAMTFNYLRQIKFLIIPDLKEDERNVLLKQEILCLNLLGKMQQKHRGGFNDMSDNDDYNLARAKFLANLEEYQIQIMDLLEEYGYRMAKKVDGSRMFL